MPHARPTRTTRKENTQRYKVVGVARSRHAPYGFSFNCIVIGFFRVRVRVRVLERKGEKRKKKRWLDKPLCPTSVSPPDDLSVLSVDRWCIRVSKPFGYLILLGAKPLETRVDFKVNPHFVLSPGLIYTLC